MLITLDPDSHRLNSILRRPLLCSAVVLHDEGQAFGGLIGIHCMRNLSIGAVLTAIYRRNKRDGAFVLLGRRIDLRLRRGKAAVDQTIVLAGLLTGGNVCADHGNDFFFQTADGVCRGSRNLMLITLDPDSHRLNSILRRPLLCSAVVLHDEGQAFGGLIGIHCMRNLSIGAVLTAICRGNKRDGAFVLLGRRIDLRFRRGKAAVDQTVELGLVGRICTDNSDDIFAQFSNLFRSGKLDPLCGVGCVPGDRFCNFGIPACEGVARTSRSRQINGLAADVVAVGGHVIDFVFRPGIKRDALERHGAVEMVSVDLAVGLVALVRRVGHERQRILAVPVNAVQHVLVELCGINRAVERELAIVNLVCHVRSVGLCGHQLAEGDELAALVEAAALEAKTLKRRNGLRIALGKRSALVGRLHVDIDGLFHILQHAAELPVLGLAECLGALVGLAEVLRILIPAVKLVAVFFNGLGLGVRAEVVFRNVDRLAVLLDLVAGLVIDGVGDGMIPVGFDSQVAGRASRNLGDLLSNAVLVQIAAPLQEGLAVTAVLRDRVQRDSLLDRVLLSVFGIKLLIRNVLVAVVVRDRVLDGRVVAVELPLLNLRRRSELFRSCFADVLLVLIPAVELIAVRNRGHPQRVGRSLRDRNVLLMQDRPTVAVLYRVSYKEGALLPDGVEGHSGVARVERQLFTGLELFCRIVGNRRRIRTCSPAEELVADALRNRVAESEDCHLVRKLKRLRYGLGHVFNIAPIRGVGQGGLADHINLRAAAVGMVAARDGAVAVVILDVAALPDGVEGHSGVARVERQLFTGLELFCRIVGNRRRIRTCSPAEELVADALRNRVAESEDCHLVRKLKRLRYGLGHVCNIAPIRGVGQGGLGDIVAGRPDWRPLCGVDCVPGDRFRNFGIPAFEGVAGVVRVFAEFGGSNAGIEVAEDHLLEELAANAVGVGDGVGVGRRMLEIYRHRIARFPSLLVRIPRIGNACGEFPQCVVR